MESPTGNHTLALPQEPLAYDYQVLSAFPGLDFYRPLALVTPPGEINRLFIVEQPGTTFVITILAPLEMRIFPSRNDAVRFVGEHSRPGCGSVRPRTGPGRRNTRQGLGDARPPGWAARFRSTTPASGVRPPIQPPFPLETICPHAETLSVGLFYTSKISVYCRFSSKTTQSPCLPEFKCRDGLQN